MFGLCKPFIKISSKKFSRVVVYCSVIKVPVILSQATALIFYQIRFALSRTFLFFFVFCCLSRVSLNIIPLCSVICQPFFTSFFNFFAILISTPDMVLHTMLSHNSHGFYIRSNPLIHLTRMLLRIINESAQRQIPGFSILFNRERSFLLNQKTTGAIQ